jgi:tripartite-type tricarboxylate transporter receptor subunit TctC
VKEGKLRALAVTAAKRSQSLPDIPTLAEAGFPDQEAESPLGVLVPSGTPPAIVDRLYSSISEAIGELHAANKLVPVGFDPVMSTPQEFAVRIKADMDKWGKVIKLANIKVI